MCNVEYASGNKLFSLQIKNTLLYWSKDGRKTSIMNNQETVISLCLLLQEHIGNQCL